MADWRAPVESQRQVRRTFIGWFVLFATIGLLVAYLNRHHIEQQSNYTIYVAMADYYRGLQHLEVLTYPTWGYPFALILIRRYDLVAIPQVLLASVAMTTLFLRLRTELQPNRRAVAVLFVLAVPWYLLHSVKWPLSFAASFSVLGLVVLERALRIHSLRAGVAAGLLFGTGLYFRSEFLFLPPFLLMMGVLSRVVPKLPRLPLPPLAACAAVAWITLIPWGVHYRDQTGHFSLTASQSGIVAFISLGQLPRNPWGAVYEDEYAYAYLAQVAPQLRVNSDTADRVLVDEFKRRVKAEPMAFAAKMIWNGAISLVSGFYGGEIPLSPTQWEQFRVLKRRPWTAVLPALTGELPVDIRTRVTFLYWLAMKIAGTVVVLLCMVGLMSTLWRGRQSALLLLLASTIAYQWLLFIVLSTEPRYKNGLYLYMVPFVVIAWQAIRGRVVWTRPARVGSTHFSRVSWRWRRSDRDSRRDKARSVRAGLAGEQQPRTPPRALLSDKG
jgi:hypothetical protein